MNNKCLDALDRLNELEEFSLLFTWYDIRRTLEQPVGVTSFTLFSRRGRHLDFLPLPALFLSVLYRIGQDVPYQCNDRRTGRAPHIDAHATVWTSRKAHDPFDVPREPAPGVCKHGGLCMPELQCES